MCIAHRGASAYAPENTLPAFQLAFEMGAHAIELDVHLSADGVPVVIHDADLSRTTDGSGRVRDHTWDELRRLDAGGWFGAVFMGLGVPSLDEALAELPPGKLVNVEIKADIGPYPGIEAAVVGALQRAGLIERCCISSYDDATIERVRRLRSGCGTSLRLRDGPGMDWLESFCHCVNLEASAVNATRVKAIHAAGMVVEVYTVNDERRMREVLALGVDALFTDRPDALARVLASS